MPVCMLSRFSRVPFFETPWTVAYQAPLSTGLPGKNTGVGYHGFLQDLPHPGTEPTSLRSPALAVGFFTTSTAWEAGGSEYATPKTATLA